MVSSDCAGTESVCEVQGSNTVGLVGSDTMKIEHPSEGNILVTYTGARDLSTGGILQHSFNFPKKVYCQKLLLANESGLTSSFW